MFDESKMKKAKESTQSELLYLELKEIPSEELIDGKWT